MFSCCLLSSSLTLITLTLFALSPAQRFLNFFFFFFYRPNLHFVLEVWTFVSVMQVKASIKVLLSLAWSEITSVFLYKQKRDLSEGAGTFELLSLTALPFRSQPMFAALATRVSHVVWHESADLCYIRTHIWVFFTFLFSLSFLSCSFSLFLHPFFISLVLFSPCGKWKNIIGNFIAKSINTPAPCLGVYVHVFEFP